MAKEERPAVEFEDDPYETEEPEIEFITEAQAAAEKEAGMLPREEAMERIRKLEGELEEQRKRGDEVSQLREAVAGLRPAEVPQYQPPSRELEQQPQETWDAYQKRINEHFFDDPASNVRDVVSKLVGPELTKLAEYAQAAVRTTVSGDPVFQRYEHEVEAEVQRRADRLSNPKIYREVTDMVAARHIDEIVADKVAAELARQQQGAQRKSPTPQFTEAGRNAPPAKRAVKRYVKTAADERDRQAAGLTETDYYRWKYGG